MLCLGIESSCDETSAAVVDSDRNILSHVIYSQVPQHQKFGGVVPELAARAHILAFEDVVRRALLDAGKTINDIDVIAGVAGPGLIGGVIVGWLGAVGMAQGAGKPLVAVNHLEAHALVPRLTNNTEFPFLLLLASGGHSQILLVRGVGDYELIGQTLDDSAGECYDKVAKMLGLGYPGGPVVDSRAGLGDSARFKFPRPLCDRPGCDFSFSGIKTAARTILEKCRGRISSTPNGAQDIAPLQDEFIDDFCASFQAAVVDVMENRMRNAIRDERVIAASPTALVVAGGVAKNSGIRAMLERLAAEFGLEYSAPPLSLCTDNGAMVAWAGIENFLHGRVVTEPVAPRPRWPLTEL
ncbi:MAG: tRNA (adenosine(37)-N6)-threonylcarbamoyltransferase complex transferase subunit TsaD [Alphaproteobacteria bacterium]|nr:tRNA (adenosine(37)-N6)-threonylcarbamoyltransferase complex transferase subunit TsaD [Alphaproteobacteria bacterium]